MKATVKQLTIFVITLLISFIITPLFAQTTRGREPKDDITNVTPIGKQWAVFIAIDKYADKNWRTLEYPVEDAKEIKRILLAHYQFQSENIRELYDQEATVEGIRKLFLNDLQKNVGDYDSVFVFHAGHGVNDAGSKVSAWIAYDGSYNPLQQYGWLQHKDVRKLLDDLKARHVFLISDSCYSGDLLLASKGGDESEKISNYPAAYAMKSHQVMSSGASQPVPDRSEFLSRLKSALLSTTDRYYIEPDFLLTRIKETPTTTKLDPIPQFAGMPDSRHELGGSFLFFRKQANVSNPGGSGSINPPPQPFGSISVTSEIAGEIIVDGQATGIRVKEGGIATITNVTTGNTEVAVRADNGTITKATQTVRVLQGQTVAAVIERPVPANMVRINGGTFTMGSPASEKDRDSDEVQHRVTVSSFYMGKYPVTQKEYQEVMGTNPSNFKGDSLPVEMVSWYDAVNYCNRLSQKEGLTPAYTINGENVTWNYNANGYRLPTEAEWEYACRAETTTPFSTGNNITTSQANYDGNNPYNNNAKGTYREKTTAVGSFSPNPWGLYDMHGNVFEWCWDWYGNYPSNAQTDPRGASSGSSRVIRGGSWDRSAQNLRSAYRNSKTPTNRGSSIGFRVVLP